MSKQKLLQTVFMLSSVLLGMGLGIGIGKARTEHARKLATLLTKDDVAKLPSAKQIAAEVKKEMVTNTTNKPSQLLEVFTRAGGSGLVVSLDRAGNITYGKGYNPTSAAKEFWNAMGKEYKSRCLDQRSGSVRMRGGDNPKAGYIRGGDDTDDLCPTCGEATMKTTAPETHQSP